MIPKSCRFGPLEGREVELTGKEVSTFSLGFSQNLALTILKETKEVIEIDVTQEGNGFSHFRNKSLYRNINTLQILVM